MGSCCSYVIWPPEEYSLCASRLYPVLKIRFAVFRPPTPEGEASGRRRKSFVTAGKPARGDIDSMDSIRFRNRIPDAEPKKEI